MPWPRSEYPWPAARRVPIQVREPYGGIARSHVFGGGRSPLAREPEPEPQPGPVADPVPAPEEEVAEPAAAVDEVLSARQRLDRERERVLADTRAQVVGEMLPVLDNLDRSLDAARTASDPALVEGLDLVRKQFEAALTRMGLERIESRGQRFDPALFEAVATVDVEDPAENGKVADEWQRGYRLGDRIVQRPKVRVAQWSRA